MAGNGKECGQNLRMGDGGPRKTWRADLRGTNGSELKNREMVRFNVIAVLLWYKFGQQ